MKIIGKLLKLPRGEAKGTAWYLFVTIFCYISVYYSQG